MRAALISTAVLTAGIVYAAPAHAGPGDWSGKMAIADASVANPNYTIPVEFHRIDDLHERMTSANGCDEVWTNPVGPSANGSTDIQGGTYQTFFVQIQVTSGVQAGCTDAPQAQVGIQVRGTHRTMTAASPDAKWLVYGDW
jgi:hypothetical protein